MCIVGGGRRLEMKLILRPDQQKKNLVIFESKGNIFQISLVLAALIGFVIFVATLLLIGQKPKNVLSFFIFIVALYCIDLRKSYVMKK